MIATRNSRARTTSAAVFVRLAAFSVALISLVVVPWSFLSAAVRHTPAEHAFAVAAVAVTLTVASALFARSYDPLRA